MENLFSQMFFSLKFNVWLQWVDVRIGVQNLYEATFLNKLSDGMALDLWTPQLVFQNTNERNTIKYVPSSSVIMLVKNGSSQEAPLSQIDEALVYSPKETKLLMKTIHFLDFKCDFDLLYFPFDLQTCYVLVCIIFVIRDIAQNCQKLNFNS